MIHPIAFLVVGNRVLGATVGEYTIPASDPRLEAILARRASADETAWLLRDLVAKRRAEAAAPSLPKVAP